MLRAGSTIGIALVIIGQGSTIDAGVYDYTL